MSSIKKSENLLVLLILLSIISISATYLKLVVDKDFYIEDDTKETVEVAE